MPPRPGPAASRRRRTATAFGCRGRPPSRRPRTRGDLHLRPHVVAPVPLRRDLQTPAAVGDAVVVADRPLGLPAEDVGQLRLQRAHQRREDALRLLRRHREHRVEPRPEAPQELVRRSHVRDPRLRRLLRQPSLNRSEGPLAPAPGLRRIRRDHLDARLGHRPPEPGRVVLVHLPARLRRVPVVGAPVRVQAVEQPLRLHRLPHPPEARPRSLLGHEEPRVHLAGRIVHRHDEVPPLPRHPRMRRGVLVQHRPRSRLPLPPLPVRPLPPPLPHQPRLLKAVLHPGVRARPAVLPHVDLLMEVPHVPAPAAVPVQRLQRRHLLRRRPAVGCPDPPVLQGRPVRPPRTGPPSAGTSGPSRPEHPRPPPA